MDKWLKHDNLSLGLMLLLDEYRDIRCLILSLILIV